MCTKVAVDRQSKTVVVDGNVDGRDPHPLRNGTGRGQNAATYCVGAWVGLPGTCVPPDAVVPRLSSVVWNVSRPPRPTGRELPVPSISRMARDGTKSRLC